MTRVFVYEYCVAIGPGRKPSDPARSLFRMGRAMRDAVADDFRRVAGIEVVTLDDAGDAEPTAFRDIASSCGLCLVIAPETRSLLAERCRWVADAGSRLLGSNLAAVELASDKLATFEVWHSLGIPTPFTAPINDWPRGRFPCAVKPIDGAGSTTTFRADSPEQFAAGLRAAAEAGEPADRLIAQDFVPGLPASVAFLAGRDRLWPLVPTFQAISADGSFRYEGCELPIPPAFADRAVSLARRAVGCVPGLLGFAGADLILGGAADGSDDRAIEVNPRVSMSYLALREAADFNLAEAMLRLAQCESMPEPRWKPERVRLRADWTVERAPVG